MHWDIFLNRNYRTVKYLQLLIFTGLVTLAINNAFARTFKERLDPNINEINRLPMHTNFFAYENEPSAKEGKMERSENFLTLNGYWMFNWVKDADQRPQDFYTTSFNDKGWNKIPVPGIWEVNGYGDSLCTNIHYPWSRQFQNSPPLVPDADAQLFIDYEILNDGTIKVSQKMKAGNKDKVPDLFRFGMQLQMPKDDDHIKYYGRGPFENYADRNNASFLGIFGQTVDE